MKKAIILIFILLFISCDSKKINNTELKVEEYFLFLKYSDVPNGFISFLNTKNKSKRKFWRDGDENNLKILTYNQKYSKDIGKTYTFIDNEKSYELKFYNWNKIIIYINDKAVYKYKVSIEEIKYFQSFFIFNNKWILEYCDNVIINGKSLNEEMKYDKIFNYKIIDNKILYFFEKNNKVYISYDDKILSYNYDEVIHNLCCLPSMYNIYNREKMIAFFAYRNNSWYYVEIGKYD